MAISWPQRRAWFINFKKKEGIRVIDMSMEKVRAVIDQACQNGKCYATIEKSGDAAVDAAVTQTIDGMGYKVAINPQEILISWS
jgi:hypothetical protein